MIATSSTGLGLGGVPSAGEPASAGRPLVVGFGEALIRLTAQRRLPLEYATDFTADVGGAELNVLVALAQLGCQARWVSRLPRNPLGHRIVGHARRHGVDLDIEWDADGRTGLYFVEEGVHPRSTQVLYDRSGSAVSRVQPGMFDWSLILSSAAAVHSTGITCALSAGAEKAVLEAFEWAAGAGVVTSFDLNYRSQLWSREAAAAALRRVLPSVDLLFASPFDLELITGSDTGRDLAQDLRRTFDLSCVVVRTQREVSPGVLQVDVDAFGEDQVASGSARASVLDAFGAGDVAVAAFLAHWLGKAPLEQAVSEAAKASAYMYTIPGDTWVRPSAEFDAEDSRLGRIRR